MKFTLATFLLIHSSDAIKLKQLPSGNEIVDAALNGMKQIEPEIGDLLYSQQEDCRSDWDDGVKPGSPEDECWSYADGALRDLVRGQEDLSEAVEEMTGTKLSTYDMDFLKTFLVTEFSDLIKNLENNRDWVASELDAGLVDFQRGLEDIGLVQTSAQSMQYKEEDWCANPEKCWEKWECSAEGKGQRAKEQEFWNTSPHSREEEEKFWDGLDQTRKNFVMNCYTTESPAAARVRDALGSVDRIEKEIGDAIYEGMGELEEGKFERELGRALEDVNEFLEHESERLGVPVPDGALPNPETVARQLTSFLFNGAQFLTYDPEGKREVRKGAEDLMYSAVKETYRAERDLKSGDWLRDIDEVAEGLQEVGIDVKTEDLQDFAVKLSDKVQEVLNDPKQQDEIIRDVERMI